MHQAFQRLIEPDRNRHARPVGKEKGSWRRVQAKIAVSTAQITQLVKMLERA
jgi:hypothetical protein